MRVESCLRRPWHPVAMVAVLALWLTTVGNLPLWWALVRLPDMQLGAWRSLALFGALLLAFNQLVLGLTLWPVWRKAMGLLLISVCAFSSYFMQAYGVVIDPTMLANALHTDGREVRDLLSVDMWWPLLFGVLLPGYWWVRQPVRPLGWRRTGSAQSALVLLSAVAMVLVGWLAFQDLASSMRNHKALRYMINPYNTAYALLRVGVGRAAHAEMPLQPVGVDARHQGNIAPVPNQGPLLLLVVGETLRADHVGMAGYGRDTSPRLSRLHASGELVFFDHVTSCGTNTEVSVPCMFSPLGRDDERDGVRQENLLDVLQRAGLAVLWLDNQSGCKGVCDRVPNASTREGADPTRCPDGECFDEALLQSLPGRLQQLDPVRQQRGTVVVLHMMGSHGPAYFKRTPPSHKVFQPECTDQALQHCERAHVVNAYDNTARYADHVLAELIDWLRQQQRPTGLWFVSDHGESLGENGLFLHGMPYAMAPRAQTHVPMLAWFSGDWQRRQRVSTACLRQKSGQPYSHDHLFHTVLGLTDVATRIRQPALDIAADCRSAA